MALSRLWDETILYRYKPATHVKIHKNDYIKLNKLSKETNRSIREIIHSFTYAYLNSDGGILLKRIKLENQKTRVIQIPLSTRHRIRAIAIQKKAYAAFMYGYIIHYYLSSYKFQYIKEVLKSCQDIKIFLRHSREILKHQR